MEQLSRKKNVLLVIVDFGHEADQDMLEVNDCQG